MKRIALFPGSFDPITLGHTSIIQRALPLFDEIIVAIGINSQKEYMFSLEQRMQWIRDCFADFPKISVESYQGLTINFCKEKNARFILRGIRNQQDFEFERSIAQMNSQLDKKIETVFLFTQLEYAAINSTIVRDIIRNDGEAQQFLPPSVKIN